MNATPSNAPIGMTMSKRLMTVLLICFGASQYANSNTERKKIKRIIYMDKMQISFNGEIGVIHRKKKLKVNSRRRYVKALSKLAVSMTLL